MEHQDPQNLTNPDESEIKDDKTQGLPEEPKANPSSNLLIESTSPKWLAWCSQDNNKISIMDLETKEEFANFHGAKVSKTGGFNWTHVKEVPNTKLLVSLYHDDWERFANMEIVDISKKGQAKKIYSFGELSREVGSGDVTYNVRRNILGAISLGKQIAYHLFSIDANTSKANEIVKLNRKSKWHPHYSEKIRNFMMSCSGYIEYLENYITGLDFNPTGESVATIDRYGVCLISDINTARYSLHLDMDWWGRCRWSSNTEEPLLYFKYDDNKLNITDVEKKALTLKNPAQLENYGDTIWIDVCQSNRNLLATGGSDKNIKIFDKRESKIVKTLDKIHSRKIYCVRWGPSGEMLASTSSDGSVKLLDFKTGKTIHTGNTSDGNSAMSICFI